MRKLSTEFQAHLDGGATTLCRCWKIKRADGQVLGFTDHDETVTFDETVFEATSGLDASALQTASGLSVDNSEALGALDSEHITEADIAAGLYDNAQIWQWVVNWEDPEQRNVIFRGTIGEIRRGSAAFEAELRGLADTLNMPVGRAYLRQCSATLGDAQCKFDFNRPEYQIETTIKRSDDNRTIYMSALDQYAPRWFSGGVLEWNSGQNAGYKVRIQSDITKNSERVITIAGDPPYDILPGDIIRLIAGCDKALNTCREKFDNVINFQGFPYIPGEDWALAYPRAGSEHDGQALSVNPGDFFQGGGDN